MQLLEEVVMRSLWKMSEKKIGPYQAIELVTICFGEINIEYALAGKNGEIWESGPREYKAVVTRDSRGHKYRYERLVRFGEDKLEEMVVTIGLPKDPRDQTMYANTFKKQYSTLG